MFALCSVVLFSGSGVDSELDGSSVYGVIQCKESIFYQPLASLPASSQAQLQHKCDELDEMLSSMGLQMKLLATDDVGDVSRLKKAIMSKSQMSQTSLCDEPVQSEDDYGVYIYYLCLYPFMTLITTDIPVRFIVDTPYATFDRKVTEFMTEMDINSQWILK